MNTPAAPINCRCVPQEGQVQLDAHQLRFLIRNAEARIEHLTGWANSMRPGDYAPPDLAARVDSIHGRLAQWRARLEGLRVMREVSSPALHS